MSCSLETAMQHRGNAHEAACMCAAGAVSPKSVQMEVRVRMSSSAIVLDGDDAGAAPILRAGTRGTTAVLRKYPKTSIVRVAVAGMGVSTPDGPIVHTGALLLPSSSILKDDGEPTTTCWPGNGCQH